MHEEEKCVLIWLRALVVPSLVLKRREAQYGVLNWSLAQALIDGTEPLHVTDDAHPIVTDKSLSGQLHNSIGSSGSCGESHLGDFL